MSEIYVSIDVESFGPIPGQNSMVNFGAVACDFDGKRLGSFEANLKELPDAVRDADTMDNFWLKPEQKDAFEHITKDPQNPADVMDDFRQWMEEMRDDKKVVLVAYPSGYDFMFLYWYWQKFLQSYPPFWFRCVDIKSYAAGKLGCAYSDVNKEFLKEYWPTDMPHTHKGVDDADEQLQVFLNLRE